MSSKRTSEQKGKGKSDKSGGTRPTSPVTSRSDTSNSSKASSPTENIVFPFLNFTHPKDAKNAAARQAVRSHVTKRQHQLEHEEAAARKAQQADSASSTVNPKDVYPADWVPYLPRIMEHYQVNMAVDIPDLDGPGAKGLLRTRFLPFILTDSASLHAVLLVAAAHYGNVRGSRSHTVDIIELRGLAIGEINKALKDPLRRMSDQLIAAVAKMALYEALFGDQDIFNMHMLGLLGMVELRGGLHRLGLEGLLERMLLWIDINAAYMRKTNVYFDTTTARHPKPDPQRFAAGLARQPSA